MSKEKTIVTGKGKLEIWEHEASPYDASTKQKYGTRIFDKKIHGNVLKIHSCAEALEVYISSLNVIILDE
jgi:hypothetical protein